MVAFHPLERPDRRVSVAARYANRRESLIASAGKIFQLFPRLVPGHLTGRAPEMRIHTNAPQQPLSTRRNHPPCVLIITDDVENFLELRVRIPFDAMVKAGLIRGYHVLHRGRLSRSIGTPIEIDRIDVVWVQRVPDRNVLFLIDALAGKFVYDLDDNLLVSPAYQRFSHTVTEIVRSLLRESKIVSATNARLLNSLQKRSGTKLDAKSVITPNLAEDVDVLHGGKDPSSLLLAMSGPLPLTTSYDGFVRGVKLFIDRRNLPIVYIGSDMNDFSTLGVSVQAMGMLDYRTYRDVLRRHNAMAIAPLEWRGDPATQEFVDCKSDVKMVDFGSLGVPAVYADVAPYQDTPLRCGPLVDMSDDRAVAEALEGVFRESAEVKITAEKSVRQHRLALTSVSETWFRAVDAGRLSEPLSLENLLKLEAGYAALSLPAESQLSVLRDRHLGRSRTINSDALRFSDSGSLLPKSPVSTAPRRADLRASVAGARQIFRRLLNPRRGEARRPFDPKY
jgi:hypothetical protein